MFHGIEAKPVGVALHWKNKSKKSLVINREEENLPFCFTSSVRSKSCSLLAVNATSQDPSLSNELAEAELTLLLIFSRAQTVLLSVITALKKTLSAGPWSCSLGLCESNGVSVFLNLHGRCEDPLLISHCFFNVWQKCYFSVEMPSKDLWEFKNCEETGKNSADQIMGSVPIYREFQLNCSLKAGYHQKGPGKGEKDSRVWLWLKGWRCSHSHTQ